MNERMYELINQCFIGTTDGKLSELNTVANIEKFADLIVQECLLSIEPNPMAPEIDYDVEQKFYQRSARKIKRHFGVEE